MPGTLREQLYDKLFPPGSDEARALLRKYDQRGELETGKEGGQYPPIANYLDRFAHGIMPLQGALSRRSATEGEVQEAARGGYDANLRALWDDRDQWRKKIGDLVPEERTKVEAALAVYENVMQVVAALAEKRPWEQIVSQPAPGVDVLETLGVKQEKKL